MDAGMTVEDSPRITQEFAREIRERFPGASVTTPHRALQRRLRRAVPGGVPVDRGGADRCRCRPEGLTEPARRVPSAPCSIPADFW